MALKFRSISGSRAVSCSGFGILAVALGLWLAPPAQAQTDTVMLRNGDRLTGEIRSLDRAMLSFDTDATNVIGIRWDHVTELTSAETFEVMLDDGERLFGTLLAGAPPSTLRVRTAEGPVDLPTIQVVRMTVIEGNLIDRIEMSADLGYSISKANELAQNTIGYDFSYRGEEQSVTFNLDTAVSSTEDEEQSVRAYSTLTYRRFLDDREWDPVAIAQIERNDELGLDRRASLGGGVSYWFTDTNRSRIGIMGGLVYSAEEARDAPSSENNSEAMFGADLEWFRFDDPELDVVTRFSVFEKLSGAARTRGNLDIDFRWELLQDFFWGLNIYYSFDNSPENPEASTNDYGLVTSLGWEF